MLKSLKKRVKGLGGGEGSGHSKTEANKLDTPPRIPSSGSVTSNKGAPSTAAASTETTMLKSKGASSSFASREEDLTTKIPYLASFDKCIETLDAITASTHPSESILGDRVSTSGLPDCSLLVSPDGDLLLVPTGEKNLFAKDKTSQNGGGAGGEQQSSFSQLMQHGKDDYESSVFIGDDLHSDAELNQFSARGWSIPATSFALETTGSGLNALAHFCEQMVLTNKESAARMTIACDNLRHHDITPLGSPTQWEIVDPRATDFEITADRTAGPFGRGTLAAATDAVSQYYALTAEKEARRWRTASLQQKGVLPTMHRACDHFQDRMGRRQQALLESSRRVRMMEDRLTKLKRQADKKWQAVYKAELKTTKKIEDLMAEKSKEKQKARLKQLHEQEPGNGAPPSSNLSEDVWNMVSSVAEAMDNGSYEPMCIPGAEATSVVSDEASTASESLPVINREEIEQDVGLPALRAAAMRADDAVYDAADTLLTVLSMIDSTRRSAKVAAETCLVGAGNAQAACLRSMVELERESLKQRLQDLDGIDEILDKVDIRSDLRDFIDHDKLSRGGTSHLAEDDDGGIASALATLSGHVESMSGNELTALNLDESDRADSPSIMRINEVVDRLFDDNATSYEASTAFLCNTATGGSSSASRQRSALCYALNAKRGAHAKLTSQAQFDALCSVFSAILTGCIKNGVANAKMCMMLSQTFYIEGGDADELTGSSIDESEGGSSPSRGDRKRRVYVKSRLIGHSIWSKDDFWDNALAHQISESLTHSGVMSNFDRKIRRAPNPEFTQTRKTMWHDLTQSERNEAASQVHAVVFAQLGALAHSMIELGCGLDRSCAFVRRMSISNQLPSSHRSMLLAHLLKRNDVGLREAKEGLHMKIPVASPEVMEVPSQALEDLPPQIDLQKTIDGPGDGLKDNEAISSPEN